MHNAVPKSGLSADGLATVVGNLPEVSPGEFLQLQGHCDRHPKHGSQSKWHDVRQLILEYRTRFPDEVSSQSERLAEISAVSKL